MALIALNRMGVMRITPYALIGVFIWACVLKSGVHATLAGVVTALCIPLRSKDPTESSPLHRAEHGLHIWVAFLILPLFAFANAGVSLAGISVSDLLAPLPLGIALGLFLGKQIGVFFFSWLAVKIVLMGSIASGVLGYVLLRIFCTNQTEAVTAEPTKT